MTQGRDGTGPHDGATRQPGPADAAPCPAGGAIRRTVRVINPRGLHHRIADVFSKTAKGFASTVTLWHGDARADGKELWDLLMLVVLPDSDVVLEVDGPDAAAAADTLTAILAAEGGEDYTI